MKKRLETLSPNKKTELQNFPVTACGNHCLALHSNTSTSFQIEQIPHLSKPEIIVSPDLKTLRLPSWSDLEKDALLKTWLVGHEVHPQIPPSDVIQHTKAQQIAFQAIKEALRKKDSLLLISPTGTGKTLVLARALKENLTPGLHLVTAHQIQLVDQLHQAIQQELQGTGTLVINWNNKSNHTFSGEVEQSLSLKEPVVFVVTTQTLKGQLNHLENKKPDIYKKLVENTRGIYLDEAHHLGAFHTKAALLKLKEQTEAFFVGTTATPVHYEINLRELFDREHWSYLNGTENLFQSHPPEKILEQLSLAIREGEVTPFEDLYVIGPSSFNETEDQPLFIQGTSDFYVLNPHHYSRLAGILSPIIQSNRKGFIVTASIAEAERLALFLNQVFKDMEFEAYHSDLTREEKRGILSRSEERESHYIVAVRALDEGVDLPHLSAYIDLNTNVSVKQMVHRIGRVLRLYPGKLGSDILFLSDYRDAKKAGDLLSLLDVVERSSGFSRGGMSRSSGDARFRLRDVKPLSREELLELRRELDSSVRNFWSGRQRQFLSKEEAYEILRKRKLNSVTFLKLRPGDPELQKIPSNPQTYYEDWSWKEVTGYGKFLSKEEAYEMLRKRELNSVTFLKLRPDDPELQKIHSNPQKYYEGWSWKEVTGYGKFLSKEEAYEILRKRKLTSTTFQKLRSDDPELQKIPSNPQKYYEGWSWSEVTGYRQYLSKEEAYEILRKRKLNSVTFLKLRPGDPELQKIPSNPQTYYEDWSWKEVTGYGKFLSKEEAYEMLRKRKLNSVTFLKLRPGDPELQKIPSNPQTYYEDWSWKEVTGYGKFLSKEEAYEMLRKRELNSVTFLKLRPDDPELQKIHSNPQKYYEGWSWSEVTGYGKFLSKEEAYEILRKRKLTSTTFQKLRSDDPELQKIPSNPQTYYEGWSWNEVTGYRQYLSKEEAYEILRKRKLNSETFHKLRSDEPELQKIPSNPQRYYEGWSWNEVTGYGQYLPKKEAYELLRRKEVNSKTFQKLRPGDPELQKIPSNPQRYYEDWDWKEVTSYF